MENRIIGTTMRKLALVAGAAAITSFAAPPPATRAHPAPVPGPAKMRARRHSKYAGASPAGRTSWRQLKRAFASGFVPPEPSAAARARHGLKP